MRDAKILKLLKAARIYGFVFVAGSIFCPATNVIAGTQDGSDETRIISARVTQAGKAVEIRTSQGTKTIAPGKDDTDFDSFQDLLVSPDRRSAVWIELQGGLISDANYPEPTSVWLFSGGHMIEGPGCPDGRPYEARFGATDKMLVVTCGFAHGLENTHTFSFDVATGRCVSDQDDATRKRSACQTSQ